MSVQFINNLTPASDPHFGQGPEGQHSHDQTGPSHAHEHGHTHEHLEHAGISTDITAYIELALIDIVRQICRARFT